MQKNRKKVLTFCNTDSILIKSVAVATDEYGILAQLGEHLPYKQRVIGSSPIGPIFMSGILKSSLCVCIEAIFFCDNFQILFRTADIDLILANIVPEVCLLIG